MASLDEIVTLNFRITISETIQSITIAEKRIVATQIDRLKKRPAARPAIISSKMRTAGNEELGN